MSDTESKRPCTCVYCDGCGGSGQIWVDHNGRYLGKHRSDDMDDMEECPECYGYGIIETCDACLDSEVEGDSDGH